MAELPDWKTASTRKKQIVLLSPLIPFAAFAILLIIILRGGDKCAGSDVLLQDLFSIVAGSLFLLIFFLIGYLALQAYYYLLSSVLQVKISLPSFNYKIGAVLAILFMILAYSLLPRCPIGGSMSKAICLTVLAKAPPCYDSEGNWVPDGCGNNGCNTANFSFPPECTRPDGPLKGTGWYKDETHFNCGPKPA
ncbi:MAG: hypothetical protein V1835_06295 [Candidatus Micrarchaeota archaeon]